MSHRPDHAPDPNPAHDRPLWPAYRLRCREAVALMLAAEDRPAALGERVRVRLHLLACGACTRFQQQLGLMHQALGRWRGEHDGADDPPPPAR